MRRALACTATAVVTLAGAWIGPAGGGLIDTLWRRRAMFGRPRSGVVGVLSMPAFVIFEMLGPLVELSGYVVVPIRDLVRLVLAGIVESLGYRQATAWWRTRGFWDDWRGDPGWGRMEPRGIGGTRAGRAGAP